MTEIWVNIGSGNGLLPDGTKPLPEPMLTYRLVSNIRCTSNIRRTLTLGNSHLEFSPTISLAETSNTRRTLSFDSWVWSRPTWSELLRVAWDFDSTWIKGPMTAHQSRPYAKHITVIHAAKLCDSIAIVFLSIEVRIWHHLRRYLDRQRHFVYCQSTRIAR